MRCLAEGDVVGGHFRLMTELGQGGMGTVWLAEHLRLRSQVAVKIIDPVIAMDPRAVHRFLREARTAAALRSPHIVQILDYGVDGERPYIAMEMLDGESLAQRIHRDGRLSVAETARVLRHVARALGRAHDAGIVHRDLKPENIFVVKNDDETMIKVLDFGIAKARPAQADQAISSLATRTGTLLGTPHFMSPEQTEGLASVDFRADLWALGVVAFECLLGELPFKGNTVTQVALAICRDPMPIPSQVGPVLAGFDAWFARACARDPNERFESAKEAAAAFEQLESVKKVPDSRPSSPASSGHRALAASAKPRQPGAVRRWVVGSRVALASLVALLLLGAVRLATEPFQRAEAGVATKPPELPAAQAVSAQVSAVEAVQPLLERPLPEQLLPEQPAAPLQQPGAWPSTGESRHLVSGSVAAERGGSERQRGKKTDAASRRVRKASTQRPIVHEPTSTRNVDLGF